MRTDDGGGSYRRRAFFTPGRGILLIVAILALILIFENTRHIKVRLLIPEVTMPLWLALLGAGIIGALCDRLLTRRSRRR